jgi:hypothetical protein
VPALSHLTSCTSNKSNLYLANSLATVIRDPALYKLLTFHVPKRMSLFRFLKRDASSRNTPLGDPSGGMVYFRIVLSPEEAFRPWVFLNKIFYGEALLAPRPICKLEDHHSSAVRDCLFNLFAVTLHIGGRSSIRNLRTRHAVVTGTHLHGG